MKQRFLPAVADGSLHVAFGVTEPDAGTDTTRITTRAVRDGDHYVINGRKVWTTKALEADRILLLTRTTPLDECAKPTHGMTLFLVDRHAAGVDARGDPQDGPQRRGVVRDDLRRRASCPSRDRVGDEGRGFHYLLDGLNAERILIAAEALGIGRAVAAAGRALRQRARRVRPPDRQEPGHRLPARRGPRQAARRRPDGPRGRPADRRRPAVRRGGQHRQVPRRRGRVLRRRPGRADPRRLRLRHRVPRRALLPRGPPAAHRARSARS